MHRDWKAALAALAIAGGYLALRRLVYLQMPVVVEDPAGGAAFSWALWFRRDLVMTVPRLLGFAATWWAASRFYSREDWGWHGRIPPKGGAVLAAVTVAFPLGYWTAPRATVFTAGEILVGWLATAPVALLEEALFRGLLFTALARRVRPLPAGLAAAFVFTVWHYGAQSVLIWPEIFAYGLAACAAFHAGVGLPWLIASHWLVDSLWYFPASEGWAPSREPAFLAAAAALGAVALGSAWVLARAPAQSQAPAGVAAGAD